MCVDIWYCYHAVFAFCNSAIIDHHPDTFSLLWAHWVWISWSVGLKILIRRFPPSESPTLDRLCKRCTLSPVSPAKLKLRAFYIGRVFVRYYFGFKARLCIKFWCYSHRHTYEVLQEMYSKYSRTSMARTPLGPWKLVRDRGSSSQWGLIKEPGQEA